MESLVPKEVGAVMCPKETWKGNGPRPAMGSPIDREEKLGGSIQQAIERGYAHLVRGRMKRRGKYPAKKRMKNEKRSPFRSSGSQR